VGGGYRPRPARGAAVASSIPQPVRCGAVGKSLPIRVLPDEAAVRSGGRLIDSRPRYHRIEPMRLARTTVGLCLLIGVYAGVASAAPEPSKAPQSWQLSFEFHDLQRISVVLPGDVQQTTFWYLLYTVTNDSGQDVEFYPAFELVTSTMEVVTGGDEISPSVYGAIRARHRKLYPFFRDPLKASGKLLQGEDNARTSAAVFRGFDPMANSVTVYVAGLSGEVARVANPVFDSREPVSEDNPRFFALRKTLAIAYDIPGDVKTRRMANMARRAQKWVMR